VILSAVHLRRREHGQIVCTQPLSLLLSRHRKSSLLELGRCKCIASYGRQCVVEASHDGPQPGTRISQTIERSRGGQGRLPAACKIKCEYERAWAWPYLLPSKQTDIDDKPDVDPILRGQRTKQTQRQIKFDGTRKKSKQHTSDQNSIHRHHRQPRAPQSISVPRSCGLEPAACPFCPLSHLNPPQAGSRPLALQS
jgi:hypothetical protein